jgi:hypothetical protein
MSFGFYEMKKTVIDKKHKLFTLQIKASLRRIGLSFKCNLTFQYIFI